MGFSLAPNQKHGSLSQSKKVKYGASKADNRTITGREYVAMCENQFSHLLIGSQLISDLFFTVANPPLHVCKRG